MEACISNSRAALNGVAGERLVARCFGVTVDTNATIDIVSELGAPLEIKTCMEWVGTAHTTTRRRRGRFLFSPRQHQKLLDARGYYMLILLDARQEFLAAKCIPADEIYHPSLYAGNDAVSINWTHLINGGAA